MTDTATHPAIPRTRRSGSEDILHATSPAGIARVTINSGCDGRAGMMRFAGSSRRLPCTTGERREGEEAHLENRRPQVWRLERLR